MTVAKKSGKFAVVIVYGLFVGAVAAAGIVVYGVVVVGVGGAVEVARSSMMT